MASVVRGMDEEGAETRERMLASAIDLIATGGVGAVTTRAVARGAGVQPPSIYRQFGDKDGLLDAAAQRIFTDYIERQSAFERDGNPVEQLRRGIETHIAFGLEHPAVFTLISAPADGVPGPVLEAGMIVLAQRIRLVARAGMLGVGEEEAVALVHGIATGMVLAMHGLPPDRREGLSRLAVETALASILTGAGPKVSTETARLAIALRPRAADHRCLTAGEALYLDELLVRLGRADSVVEDGPVRSG